MSGVTYGMDNMTIDNTFERKEKKPENLTEEDLFAQADLVREMTTGKQYTTQRDVYKNYTQWKLSQNDSTIENTCLKKTTILTPTIYQDFLRNYYKHYKNKGILIYNSVGFR